MKKSILHRIKHLKKNQRIWFIISVILYLALSCFLYAVSMTCFVNSEGSNLLTSGLSGFALVLARYVLPHLGNPLEINLTFSILYEGLHLNNLHIFLTTHYLL